MITIGIALWTSSPRTRFTSLRPSITGMLMSVRRMSKWPPASFLSASRPSSASTTVRFLMRDSANTRSWRIVGLSSTTKAVRAMSSHQVHGSPEGGLAIAELARELRALQRRRGVRGEQVEQLEVHVGQLGLLLQELPHHQRAHHLVLDPQRRGEDRLGQVDRGLAPVGALG